MYTPRLSFSMSTPSVPEFFLDAVDVTEDIYVSRKRADVETSESGGRNALRLKIDRTKRGWVPPPTSLAMHISKQTILAFDVKAQGLLSPRVVQLSWALRVGDRTCFSKERYFGSEDGSLPQSEPSMFDTLTELLTDVLGVLDFQGGILVTHGLSYKSSILHALLLRYGFQNLAKRWSACATGGFCLMSPAVSFWLEECASIDGNGERKRSQCVKLFSECSDPAKANQQVMLYLEAFAALQSYARPPCWDGEARHEPVYLYSGPRDNGEHFATCRVCGQTL